MRYEHYERTFTAVAHNGIVADQLPMLDFDRVFIAIETTSVAGNPTSFHYDARPQHGPTVVDTQQDSMRSGDQTPAQVPGTWPVDRIRNNSTIVDESWEVSWPQMQITADFAGGTSPTVTGIVHIMGRIR